MKIFYIGHFPSPYGGVTIKNKMLYDSLLNHVDIQKIDLGLIKKGNIKMVVRLCAALINPSNTFVIGAASTSRKFFTALLYYINRGALNRSLLIVMGGIASQTIASDPNFIKWVKKYKCIYVQTMGMKEELSEVDILNVDIFPTCRVRPLDLHETTNKENMEKKKLRCVFFSLISKDKGADIVLEAAKLLKKRNVDVFIDFYGHIEAEYEAEFEKEIQLLNDVNYCGVFKPDESNVYKKLQEYNVLLFPTRWKAEGTPGILVESKIAGIPAIASNINYNSEIIENNENGIILQENTPIELANSIEILNENEKMLLNMKINAKASSEHYILENYIDDFVKMLQK